MLHGHTPASHECERPNKKSNSAHDQHTSFDCALLLASEAAPRCIFKRQPSIPQGCAPCQHSRYVLRVWAAERVSNATAGYIFQRLHSIPPVPPTFTRMPSRQLLQTDTEHLLELPDRKRTHLFSHVCVFSIVSLHSLAHTTFLLLSRPFCTSPSSTTTAQRLQPARPADCHPSSQPAQLAAKCFWEL